MKFYPADWRADQALRVCSLAARGLWIECLCIAHEADRYGHLLINGKPVTHEQLSLLTGTPPDQVSALMAELESAGVFSRSGSGSIYSRRMTRDDKRARNAQQNGQRGGNPTLSKTKENGTPDKGKDNHPDNRGDKAQSPEARVQKKESSLCSDSQLARRAFGEFWMLYPRKVGGKAIAEAKFIAAAKSVGIEPIMTGLRAYADHWRAAETEERFIPHPTTWLQQRRWTDDLPANARPSQPRASPASGSHRPGRGVSVIAALGLIPDTDTGNEQEHQGIVGEAPRLDPPGRSGVGR
jgi:hypothetical protein